MTFGILASEIRWRVWGTPANFNGFRVLAALLHCTAVVRVSQSLQGGHYVGHWPTFLVVTVTTTTIKIYFTTLASAEEVNASYAFTFVVCNPRRWNRNWTKSSIRPGTDTLNVVNCQHCSVVRILFVLRIWIRAPYDDDNYYYDYYERTDDPQLPVQLFHTVRRYNARLTIINF